MRVHVLTLRYSQTLGGFDDTPIRDLTRDRELLAFREHFFSVGDVPHLACVLEIQEPIIGAAVREQARERGDAGAPTNTAAARDGGHRSSTGARPDCNGRQGRPNRLADLHEAERALSTRSASGARRAPTSRASRGT